ncbi:MAG: NUDIX domain-containing protein [Deltaproteobacteria bacterium]|nr:NUDIX domain-containing protein [Deltaproteobacteria bacterium]
MVVDSDNRPAGAAPRSRMRAQNLFHRAVYVLVFNSEGKLFRHRRTFTKDIYPGYYDIAAGGVVLAVETYEAAAARELEEEMGIRDTPLAFLFDMFFEDPKSRVFGRVFRCTHDGDLVLQAEEVLHGAFLPIQQILADAEHLPYTPDGVMILKRLLNEKNINI